MMVTFPSSTQSISIYFIGPISVFAFATDPPSLIRRKATETLSTEFVSRNADETGLLGTFVPPVCGAIEGCARAMKNRRFPGVTAAKIVFVSIAHCVPCRDTLGPFVFGEPALASYARLFVVLSLPLVHSEPICSPIQAIYNCSLSFQYPHQAH
jgi:hypothetical protein